MKKVIALVLASMLWACQSEPTVEDTKPGVEDRSIPAPPLAGPGSRDVKPLPPVGEKPLPPTTRGGANALKDPSSPLSKRSVFFDYDNDAVKDEYRPLVQAHAKYLADNASARMLIQGNCDERGSREYNIALGQRRADNLKRMLLLFGARENQIETVSLGEEKPRCNDQSEACYQQNRRDDMLYNGEF
jgi:peptidoglycan-associated lipoprotein